MAPRNAPHQAGKGKLPGGPLPSMRIRALPGEGEARAGRRPLPEEGPRPALRRPAGGALRLGPGVGGGAWRGGRSSFLIRWSWAAVSPLPPGPPPRHQAHFLWAERQAPGTKGQLLSPCPLTPGGHTRQALISAPEQQVRKSQAEELWGRERRGAPSSAPIAKGAPPFRPEILPGPTLPHELV